ncbi:hypothetical protein NIES4102_09710 [Chondrocystis sp. NIES-4102]|nr:hypothetical protein NIES4102_09710 [Chondrocystis sp. NIES-4102]
MEEKFNQQQAQISSSTYNQQQRLSATSSTINNTPTPSKVNDNPILTQSDVILDAEISIDNHVQIKAKLAQLRKLRDEGVITEAGFQAKEKEILDLYF